MTDALLLELEEAANAAHPRWSASLAAGLSPEQIEEILAPLGGWRPPDDVLALYAWHDGQVGDDEHCLWVPCGLLPLAQAVAMFVQFRENFPQWPPLLAIGYGSRTGLEVPLSRRAVKTQPLYLRDNEGMPFKAFNSVKGLLEASIACYRAGIFRWSDEYAFWEDRLEDDPKDNRRNDIRLRFNRGASPTVWDEREELGKHWINPHDASTWPKAWQSFIGFDAKAFEPVGATATITDVVVGRVDWSMPVIIQSAVDGLMGGADFRVTLSDGTQFLQVICKGALSTGVVLGDRFEFELERPLDADESAALREQDEVLDRAIRKSVRTAMDHFEEQATGRAPDADELGFADFFGWEPGKSNLPVFFAKRVALVERVARDEDGNALEALEELLGDDDKPNLWQGRGPFKPATDIEAYAASILENYHNNYQLLQKYAPANGSELDVFDERLFDRVTRILAKEGFAPLGDWEVANIQEVMPNMPRIAQRAFSDRAGTVGCLYTFHDDGWASMIPPRKPPPEGVLDLVSVFADGRYLLTSAAGDLLKYNAPPLCQREVVPLGSRALEVLARHRERVRALAPPGKPVLTRTLDEFLKQGHKRHKYERKFHLGRVPTPEELVKLGANPELSERVHAAMKLIVATFDPDEG